MTKKLLVIVIEASYCVLADRDFLGIACVSVGVASDRVVGLTACQAL